MIQACHSVECLGWLELRLVFWPHDSAAEHLGVWAAEGFENDHPKFDLSESRRSDFLEGAKGSRTPEITTFRGADLLPPRLLAEMAALVAEPDRFAQFIAYNEANRPVGLVEAALRSDYVNGTNSSPVAFLEGVFVLQEERRRGIAHALVGAVESWARDRGCTEFASDASTDSPESHKFHYSLGFEETERVVYFKKVLAPE